MRYEDLMKVRSCPFCPKRLNDPDCHQVIYQANKAALMVNRAPYVKDHLMVVPLRHVTSVESLTQAESQGTRKLVMRAVSLLKKRGHKAYSILVRQGKDSGKSVQHVHVHVIPDVVVTDKEHASAERPVMTERKLNGLVRIYQKLLDI